MRVFAMKNDDEFKKTLSEKMRLIYDVGTSTGLRISDIISMKKNILDIKEPTIREQKTGKSKRIYIKKEIRKRMKDEAEKSKNEYIFYSKSSTGHISRQAVYKAFKAGAIKAKIDINIGTHSMRKKYARKLKKKHNLKYIQSKLNHKSISDSLLYITDENI